VLPVVATAGTAMTDNHLRALRRLTGNVRLAFDGDKAGIAATERAIPIASEVGVELTIITLPGGAKDPDELIQQDVKLWEKAIDSSQPAVDWILDQYSKREDTTTAAGKRNFTTAALNVVRGLKDAVEQDHYEKKIAEMIGSSLDAIKAKLTSITPAEQAPKRKPIAASVGSIPQDISAYQDNLLSVAMIDAPSQELFVHTNPEIFAGEQRQAVARYLASHAGTVLKTTPEELQNFDTYVKILLLKADARYADWNDQDRYFETARLLRQVANEHKKQTQEQLTNQLREAESAGDDARALELRSQLNTLIKEITRGQR
jgi:DNA primase